jgi:galactokinase
MNHINLSDLRHRFVSLFGATPQIYRAPGRVNLIGEHTDYNEGFVLPAAINYSSLVAIAPRAGRIITIRSEHFDECVKIDLDEGLRPVGNWSDYLAGVCWVLKNEGFDSPGADILVSSDVPVGAGLSSSAAVEVSMGYALLKSWGLTVDRKWLALACQRAENEFAGAHCGIMDQFVACHGLEDHAIMLDCRSLEHRAIPISPAMRLVVCNTMVRHSIATGEYNARRAECEESVRVLAEDIPGLRSLRDVSLAQLNDHVEQLGAILCRRARHVVTENERVLKFAAALARGETQALKSLMMESHESMRDDYEVSCKELDIMVEIASRQKGFLGGRMTGGGFGGCTVNLVEAGHAEGFKSSMTLDYFASTGIQPDVYICRASEGASEVTMQSLMNQGT